MWNCKSCIDDVGFCVYCQKQFASPQTLHTHIKRAHPDTVRRTNCYDWPDTSEGATDESNAPSADNQEGLT